MLDKSKFIPLVDKYSKLVPRYTSYPSFPYWKNNFNLDIWKEELKKDCLIYPNISLYLHLPFCESLCHFCGCNKIITSNHDLEVDYIGALIAEWNLYQDFLPTRNLILQSMHLGGGTPTFFSPKNLENLMTNLFKNIQIPQNPEFSFEAHPGKTNFEHLSILFSFGFKRVSFGIQDFDPYVQKKVSRFQSKEQVYQTVEWARKLGYESINFDLIYGLPGQSFESLKLTLNEISYLKPERIAFYSYAHIPWIKPIQRSFQDDDIPSPNDKIQFFLQARDQILEMGYLELGIDHFVLPNDKLNVAKNEKSLFRNFMGYTETHTNVNFALGISSIAESNKMYVQNDKNLSAYIHKVTSEKQLPIVCGTYLSPDQLLIRNLIQDIMCYGCADWSNWSLQDVEKIVNPALPYLSALKEDGLLEFYGHGVQSTNLGRFFLRNIAATFDPDYVNSTREQMHSSGV